MCCRCIDPGSAQDKFDDEITFASLANGSCICLKNGSITDGSSRPFKLNRVYIITRLPGPALKFIVSLDQIGEETKLDHAS